ncbi:MAG TPA: ammonium transporter [Planctomycetota bacterium]|nr:ammonium transporter [Planctomycetota bacterium]
MLSGNSRWGSWRAALGGTDRATLQRWAILWLALVALGWFYLIPKFVTAQEKKDEPKPAAGAPKTAGDLSQQPTSPPAAPATSPVSQSGSSPQNDPNGTKTGDESTAIDASGTAFSASDPGPAPEPKDFKEPKDFEAAKKDYADRKKAFDAYTAQIAKEPLALKLAKAVGHNRVSINMVWTLLTGFLVMFMQAGFALVETGLCRAKNVSHTMAMNFMIYPLSMLGFYVCGYAFMFGGWGSAGTMGGPAVMDGVWSINGWNMLGTKGFFLQGKFYDTSVFALFFFQMVFMDTAATIPTGAAAERWKFSAFMLYGFCIGTIMYPIYGNWVWGGGWCSQLGTRLGLGHGTVDFAGSSVVHLQGGVIAFWFAKMLGPRVGKYNKDGSPNVIPPHNIAMCVIGTFILAFGWFGFNPGSSLAGTDLRNAMSAVNTMLASATSALAATLWIWKVRGNKPDTSMMCNGMLAGLVAITAPCAFVGSFSACIIGIVSGILVVESVFFVEQKLKIDDPVGAISIHGTNGLWGILSVGIFADGSYPTSGFNNVDGPVKGLLFGDSGQLAAQAIGALACLTYLSVISLVVYKTIDAIVGNRVSAEVEIEGLDVPEMGALGYCGVVMDKASESPVSR